MTFDVIRITEGSGSGRKYVIFIAWLTPPGMAVLWQDFSARLAFMIRDILVLNSFEGSQRYEGGRRELIY